ncbi:MAG TPA: M3 family metallopeptidase, partial [Elusimicrobiales bacterium]|nr:M3 family metallopeptidase [Elusimicrobiales bacterium]
MRNALTTAMLVAVFCVANSMAYKTSNPLKTKQGYLRFDSKPAKMLSITKDAQKYLDEKIADIVKIPTAKKTFSNTIFALESAMGEFDDRTLTLLMAADYGVTQPIRDAGGKVISIREKYMVDTFMRGDLYGALKSYLDKKPKLTKSQKHVTDKIMYQFEKNGLNLSPEKQAEFKKIIGEIIDFQIVFNANLNKAKAYVNLDKSEVKYLKGALKDKLIEDGGKYKVDITMRPVYFSFLQTFPIQKRREEAERNFVGNGGTKNVRILEKVVALRSKLAKLLGYKTYADYALKSKMAKTTKNAMDFVSGLTTKLKIKAAMDDDKFLKVKREMTGDNLAVTLNEWDWGYYADQYKKKSLNVDMAKVREYFPTYQTIRKSLDMFGRLFGVKFEKANIPLPHPDVLAYRVKENGKVTGYLYMDLFARDGKYTHAQCEHMISYRRLEDGSYQKPVAFLMFTVDKTTVDLEEISSFYHEFGHAIHGLFSKSPYGYYGRSFYAAHDFIEVPSMMSENWLTSPQVVKYLSGHYKTGKQLSDAMIQRVMEAQQIGIGHSYQWFATQDMFDLVIHTSDKIDANKVFADVHEKVKGRKAVKGNK